MARRGGSDDEELSNWNILPANLPPARAVRRRVCARGACAVCCTATCGEAAGRAFLSVCLRVCVNMPPFGGPPGYVIPLTQKARTPP